MSPRDSRLTDATVQSQDATARKQAEDACKELLDLLVEHHPDKATPAQFLDRSRKS